MRWTLPLAVFFLLLAPCGGSSAADGEYFTKDQYGFRIKRPEAPWSLSEPASPAGARYTLKLGHNDGKTETSVTVYVTDAKGLETSKAARDGAEKTWNAEPKISGITRGIESLAAGEACWLRANYDAGTKYVLRQHFFVKNDFVYILQSAAPATKFGAAEKDFTAILATFSFVPLDKSVVDIAALATRCGSDIQWAATWEEASRRAKAENKLILVVFEVYRGVVKLRIAPSRTFMDDDVIELVNERFIAMNWTDATNAPFDDPAVYGLGPSTFGQGLLFATHEGKVVGQAVSFNPFHVYERAREILKKHPGAPATDAKDAVELLRRGDLDEASRLLESPSDAKSWRLRASLERKRRHGAAAQQALKKARDLGDGDTLVEEAVIQLRQGSYAKTLGLLEGLEAPAATYWCAIARGMTKGASAITPELRELCKQRPESRFAWRAAALLELFDYAPVMDDPRWPDAAHMAVCEQPPFKAAPDAASAQKDAIAFLLKTQQKEGAWLSPMSLSPEVSNVAIMAICAEGLLPHRANKDVARAIELALERVLEAQLIAENTRTFDYTVWSQIFALRFLARCVKAGVGDKTLLLQKMNALVAGLDRTRQSGGGWSYVRLEGRADNSIGFVTAAALCALYEAEGAGAKMRSGNTEARKLLEGFCQPRGSFRYMGGGADREAEGSLRAPLYALALKRHKSETAPDLESALEIYLKHHEHTRKERGKGLCHTGPEGFASYYLLFGYGFSAAALAELEPGKREKYKAALLEDVMSLRLEDGSFCDNAMMGRHYGAGMALHVLNALQQP